MLNKENIEYSPTDDNLLESQLCDNAAYATLDYECWHDGLSVEEYEEAWNIKQRSICDNMKYSLG